MMNRWAELTYLVGVPILFGFVFAAAAWRGWRVFALVAAVALGVAGVILLFDPGWICFKLRPAVVRCYLPEGIPIAIGSIILVVGIWGLLGPPRLYTVGIAIALSSLILQFSALIE
jgi:hypothetical protein